MKRHALIKHLQAHGCVLFREGSRHSIYWNPANRQTSAVPRHSEIVDKLARKICKDLGIPPI
jgi:predicted RNA binding protein YcfA (HicA-like mRNA interferase family)